MNFTMPTTINEQAGADHYKNLYGEKLGKIAIRVHNWIYIRSSLSESQNHRCCYCGCKTTDERYLAHSATVEHVIPKSLGGSDKIDNLVMSCNRCNSKRGIKSYVQFMHYLWVRKIISDWIYKLACSESRESEAPKPSLV